MFSSLMFVEVFLHGERTVEVISLVKSETHMLTYLLNYVFFLFLHFSPIEFL